MPGPPDSSPFNLGNDDAYRAWRAGKLASIPAGIHERRVRVHDLAAPSREEIRALCDCCRRTNWAIFRADMPRDIEPAHIKIFAAQLGLHHVDRNPCAEESGVTALTTRELAGTRYIPYTNRPLSWHTDGYYNDRSRQIRSWVLFCVQDAAEGGGNSILDHELVYLRLRDRDPELVAALMADDAMTIPANEVEGEPIRPDQTGPVFSVDPAGNLHMRYTARKRNIHWKNHPATQTAAAAIEALLSDSTAPICHYRLQPGEGIVSNNVLHRREGFRDDPDGARKRFLYRARYYDRVAGTGVRKR